MMRELSLWQHPSSLRQVFRRDMEDFFDQFFSEWDWARGYAPSANLVYAPPAESYTDGQTFHLKVDLPGIDPSEVDLSIDGNMLTLKGERKGQHEETTDRQFHREMRYGRFMRTFLLPDGIQRDAVHASYHNGVLDISLPLAEAMLPKKVPVLIDQSERKQIAA